MLNVSSKAPKNLPQQGQSTWTPNWSTLNDAELERVRQAGAEVKVWTEILDRTGDNPVTEILRGTEELIIDEYYPEDTVQDAATASQYYFHAHADREGEYGHFHTYLMSEGLPEGMRAFKPAVKGEHDDPYATHCHLVGISMMDGGVPASLFTVNHWSTHEACYSPQQVAELLDRFDIVHASPSWPANRWVSCMLRLFRPQILELLNQRQIALQNRGFEDPTADPAADEDLEVTSQLPIDVAKQIADVDLEIARRQNATKISPGANLTRGTVLHATA